MKTIKTFQLIHSFISTMEKIATMETMETMEVGSFRLFDFQTRDECGSGPASSSSSSGDSFGHGHRKFSKDKKCFTIHMFGINEQGETCCVTVRDQQPFFYA